MESKPLDKRELNEETRKVLDLLPYEDAELMHHLIVNLATKKGILK